MLDCLENKRECIKENSKSRRKRMHDSNRRREKERRKCGRKYERKRAIYSTVLLRKNMKIFCSRKYEKLRTVCRKGGPGPSSLLAPSPSLNSQGK